MRVMGVNLSHDGSVCVIENGQVIYYAEEERYTHTKHTTGVINSFAEAMRLYDPEHVVFVGAFPHEIDADAVFSSLMLSTGLYKHFENNKKYNTYNFRDHHLSHAALAFYNSGFENAAVLVVDGAGQSFIDSEYLYRETETIFSASRSEITPIYKNLIRQLTVSEYDQKLVQDVESKTYFSRCNLDVPTSYEINKLDSNVSIGKLFSLTGIKIFNSYHNAGKVMGLSAYGTDNPEHPRAFTNGIANQEILQADISNEDLAYRVQHDSLEPSLMLIKRAIETTGLNKVCLSGGYFLNCVNNYKYLKAFPDIEFYVEPNSADSGTAIGAALFVYRELSQDKSIAPINRLYLGKGADYSYDSFSNDLSMYDATPDMVAELIANRNIVAIYQGKAESGPRALGNRSILYDPRDPNGRDVVNTIKKREYFRPFAGSVLEEHAHAWFDMASLVSSPHMMYAVEAKLDKRDLVPALQHNDGTSRIQTVSLSDNENYYRLIESFYHKTGIPMILNTSFNLAGDTLVNSFEDAIRTCTESGIRFLYIPEKGKVVLLPKRNN
jgi:carbamoyltransferase